MNAPLTAPSPLSWMLRPDGIAVVSYDLAGAPRNVLEAGFIDAFERTFDALADHPDVRGAVLISKKPGTWIAGAGPSMLATLSDARAAEAMSRAAHRMLQRLASSKPIVAAIAGAAFGGGLEIALACQGRVLADDRTTVLALPEIELGLIPGMSGLQRLAARAGLNAALEYGLTGKGVRPSTARALGLADEVVAPPMLVDAAAALARTLAQSARGLPERPLRGAWDEPLAEARRAILERTRGHLPAPLRALDVLGVFANEGLEASQDLEARAFGELASSEVSRQLVQVFLSALAAKEDPGVDAPGVRGRSVRRVAIVGHDPTELGASCARAGLEVSQGPRDADLAFLFGDTGNADREALRRLEDEANEGLLIVCPLASPPLLDVVSASRSPAHVVGVRQAGVAPRLPLFEVARSSATSDESVATAVALGKRLGRTVIVVRDTVNGYAHRLRAALAEETRFFAKGGVPIAIIGEALAAWGWALSPHDLLGGEGPGASPGPMDEAATPARMVERCVLRVVNEAALCLDEGVIRSPRDGDLGAIEGAGFPRFRGGPFRYVDATGALQLVARLEGMEGGPEGRITPAQSLRKAAREGARFY